MDREDQGVPGQGGTLRREAALGEGLARGLGMK
jgi:hypothetical protein